ncbi:FlgD immunoglobulin-like domain containing protein, partial [Streptomyces sp. NPDC092046]|uniref:FlgD immunoglobulin-like domain containing protein n=1 Tax=Streptomyces sp. NPDC092046 TaxID=3366009 RepID=UPI00381DDA0D
MRQIRTRRRARIAAIAVALSAALATVSPLGAGTAIAAPSAPAELVIPAERHAAPDAGRLQVAGSTGFLRGDEASGLKWVPYDGGTVIPYANPHGDRLFGTGRDLIARLSGAQDKVDFTDVLGETTMTVAIPSGHRFAAVMGTEVVTQEYKDGAVVAVHALSVVDGVAKDRTVWGFRPGTTDISVWSGDNPKGFFLSYQLDGLKKTAWIRAETLGQWTLENARSVSAAGGYVFIVTPEKRLQVWGADVFGGQGPLRELDWPDDVTPVGMVGNQVITRSAYDPDEATLTAYSGDGGLGRVVLTQVRGDIRITPDGRLLAVRFGSEGIRTVQALRVEINGGALRVDTVHQIPLVPTSRHRIAVAQGELSSVDQIPWEQPHLRGTRLSATEPVTAEPVQDRGTGPDFDAHCGQESDCPTLVPTGDGRVVYRNSRQDLVLMDSGKQLPGTTVVEGGVVGDVEASGRYVSFLSPNSMQKVLDLDTGKIVFARGGFAGQATSLEGGSLWVEGATAGTVDALDVRTGATLRSVKVADCSLKDLQVRRSAVYWKCDATSGVTDLDTKTTTALPGHDTAVLGEGYVAHAEAGTLSLTPLRGDDRATRTIGRPADARPGFGWAVDRFGGHLAWVDDLQRTHVAPSGVRTPDVFVVDSVQPSGILDRKATTPQKWSAKWWFSKPVRRWSVTFVSESGAHQRTLQGWEQIRGALEVNWDGTDPAGQPMPDGLYNWTLTAEPEDELIGPATRLYGEVALTRLSSLASGRYQPVTPARVMDTRNGTGVAKEKIGPGGTVSLQVTGRGGVPESTAVSAVVLNVTATNPTASTFVSAYPYGTTRTSASNLNVVAGQTVPNLVVVPVKDGKVTFYNRSGSVDLIADVAGYYWPGQLGSLYEPVTPARLMDTRSGIGVPKAKVGADQTVTLTVAGQGGVPASDVTAVVLNVTATNPTASTFVSVYPYGTTRTSASNLNVVAGQTVPNLVVVPVKAGRVTFYNRSGSIDLLADVAGYFTSATSGSLYEPVTPARLMDTRSGIGVPKAKVGADQTVTLTVAGQGGVPASDVTAVVLNVTATNPTASTFVSVYPYGTTRTSASNLNVVAGQTVPNLVVVPVKDGKVTFYNRSGSIDLLADVAGYYRPGQLGSLYEPVTPARLMDTRSGIGVPKAKVGADQT